MKNISKRVTILVFTLLVASLMTVPISAVNNRDFDELQQVITEIYYESDNSVVEKRLKIEKLVLSFDVDYMNNIYNTSYTNKELLERILYELEHYNYELEQLDKNRTLSYCGANFNTSGWNYNRFFRNKSNTIQLAYDLEKVANDTTLIGIPSAIIALLGPIGQAIATGMGIGTIFNVWFYSGWASALRYNNEGHACGTVSDLNKFFPNYSVWSQVGF